MRIGVTGATGFLGSHVMRRLAADGHEVVGLRRTAGGAAAEPDPQIAWVVGDVTDPGAVERLVTGCDAVVHTAAVLTYWRGAAAEHERVNVGGTRNVAAASRAAGVGRVVHVSSVAAIAATGDGTPADERGTLGPERRQLSYHDSKLRAEGAVAAEIERGLDAVIVNPASIHGPYLGGFRGAKVVESVRKRRVVPCYSGGTSIAHVDDVVSGIVGALDRGRSGERYILAGENNTWRRIAEVAAEALRVRRTFVTVPSAATAAAAALGEALAARRGTRPRFSRDTHFSSRQYLYFDSAKAEHELGYRFRPYRAIVQEYVDSRAAVAA